MAISLVTKQFARSSTLKREKEKTQPKIFFSSPDLLPLSLLPLKRQRKLLEDFAELDKPNLLLFHLIQPTLKKSPNKNSTEEYFSQSEIK